MAACERCRAPHAGAYGSGRFCGAACAKQVGAARKWAIASDRARALPALLPVAGPLAPAVARPPTAVSAARPAMPPNAAKPGRSVSPTTIAIAAARDGHVCEGCRRPHAGTYGSGRFCSVNCARRTAAARKWAKQRAERRRLAAAAAPLPPVAGPPGATTLGKRRRLPVTPLAQPQPVAFARHVAPAVVGPPQAGHARIAPTVLPHRYVPVMPLPMSPYFSYPAPMHFPGQYVPVFAAVPHYHAPPAQRPLTPTPMGAIQPAPHGVLLARAPRMQTVRPALRPHVELAAGPRPPVNVHPAVRTGSERKAQIAKAVPGATVAPKQTGSAAKKTSVKPHVKKSIAKQSKNASDRATEKSEAKAPNAKVKSSATKESKMDVAQLVQDNEPKKSAVKKAPVKAANAKNTKRKRSKAKGGKTTNGQKEDRKDGKEVLEKDKSVVEALLFLHSA